ncbi:MAG TPA: hypothetical protein VFW80_13530 [Gaiellaceae bacterium]|nr:hypothetical protein [Gaiellaceae bacterium]
MTQSKEATQPAEGGGISVPSPSAPQDVTSLWLLALGLLALGLALLTYVGFVVRIAILIRKGTA